MFNSMVHMKELVFLFIHFNNIQGDGIEHFTQIRNQQTWPVLEAAWLRRPSETNRFRIAVTKVMAIRRLSRSKSSKSLLNNSSDPQLQDAEDEPAEQPEAQVYYYGG